MKRNPEIRSDTLFRFLSYNLHQGKADFEEEGDVRTGIPAPAGGRIHRLA